MISNAFPRVSRRAPRRLAALALAAALTILLGGSCRSDAPTRAAEPGTVDMRLGDKDFRLWIAATEESRVYGLMNRRTMAADRGMVFVFTDEEERGFWMKNTYIPLDLVYVSADGQVVSIKQGKPLDESLIPSEGKAKYTIELNAGAAAAARLKVGDRITIPPSVRAPPNLE